MRELSRALERYREGHISWEVFYRTIYEHLTTLLTRRFQFETETARELLADFYPRLIRICRDYQESGSTFEAYLYTCVRYYISEWTRKQRDRRHNEVAISSDDDIALAVSEDPDAYPATHCIESGLAILANSRQRDTVRRQLLICLCKNLPLLTPSEIERYAAMFGLPLGWITSIEASLDTRRASIARVRTSYREHRDRHYASMIEESKRTRVRNGTGEPIADFHRRRWSYYCGRLSRQTVHLSNREVAQILGISKGSVDSALANLSRRLASLTARKVRSVYDNAHTRVK